MTNAKSNRTRLALLSLSLLAALATTPAWAESDNHVRPPVRYGSTDIDYNTGNPMPTIQQELQYRGTLSPIMDPSTGAITYYTPVLAPQVNVPPSAPVLVTPPPAPPQYAPPAYAPAAYRPFVLNQNQVAMSLERQGYHRIQNISFDRGYYTARARDQHNRTVRLTVSAETGRVLDVR